MGWWNKFVPSKNDRELARMRPMVAKINEYESRLKALPDAQLQAKTARFREIFEKRAADYINPDICNCGGLLELKEIAAMAEPYHIAVAPHNYNSTTLGLAATVHACATMPNW